MAISINHSTLVITIPQSFLTLVSGSLYQLDVNALRLALKDLEDDAVNMDLPDTHRHSTQVTLSGVVYARVVEIINGFTVTFEDGQYAVRCVGANHNLADVKNLNQVSLIIGNSAGLINGQASDFWGYSLEAGYTADQIVRLMASVLMGKVSGAGSGVETFRNLNDTANRVVSTNDIDGNRTGVTLTP